MANTMRATYLTRAMTAPSISSMTLVVLASIAESMSVVVIVASSKTDNDGYGVAVDDATAYGGCYGRLAVESLGVDIIATGLEKKEAVNCFPHRHRWSLNERRQHSSNEEKR